MQRSFSYALIAALTFGLGVPLSKALLEEVDPALLAGLLYLGAALAILTIQRARVVFDPQLEHAEAPVRSGDLPWLTLALLAGGVAGPLFLLFGLDNTGAGGASLLLSLEAVFTALLAAALFAESVSRRMFLGMAAVLLAAAVLAIHDTSDWGLSLAALGIVAATACFAIDNNCTGKISLKNPATIVIWKGLIGGTVNTLIAVASGVTWPDWLLLVAALGVGAVSYGLSLALFILAMRDLGSARAASLFAAAPFFGAALSAIMFADSRTWVLIPAAAAVGLGTWLLAGERHEHLHEHQPLVHEHRHIHDEHHQHRHDREYGAEPHSHAHAHAFLAHSHPHVPDIHHRHE